MPIRKSKKSPSQSDDSVYELVRDLGFKIDSISDKVANLDKKTDLNNLSMDKRLEAVEKLDQEQNALLRQHAQRSEELKRDNELREATLRREIFPRLNKLEEPRKWLENTRTALLWIGGTCAAIMAILKLLHRL